MRDLSIVRLSGLAALGLALLLSGTAFSQQKSLKDQLVGSWTLVSASQTTKDGGKSDRWGSNPQRARHIRGRRSILIHDFSLRRSEVCFKQHERCHPGRKQGRRTGNDCQLWNVVDRRGNEDAYDEHRGLVISQFDWGFAEADHHFAYGGRTEIHQPCLPNRHGR